MTKLQVLLVIACISFVAISEAQGQQQQQRQRYSSQRLSRGRSRYFARQELAPAADPDAVTPYPSADELKPEVPFDEAAAPAAVEPTPDAVYGPPDAAQAPNNVPDEVYGPPDVVGNDLPATADVPAEQARLVAARRTANLRRAQPIAYRRVAAAAVRPAKLIVPRSVVRRL